MRSSRSLVVLLIVLMLALQAGALLPGPPATSGTGDGPSIGTDAGTYWDERAAPFTEGHATEVGDYERVEDLTVVTGGLTCGVGGNGLLVSNVFTITRGKVWDYAYVRFDLPSGQVGLEVVDPDTGAYPASTVLASALADEPGEVLALDLGGVDAEDHPNLQLAISVSHAGGPGTPPLLVSWRIGQRDADLWHDPFLGLGRDTEHGDLSLRDGEVKPVTTHIPGGLLGDYYDSLGFNNWELQRLDQVIDFDWGNGPPAAGMGSNTFSIRWAGKIMIPADDIYTFYLRIDDGGRLWIDDALLIDEWADHNPTEFSGQVHLAPGLHDIRIDYYENQGGAQCHLRWSSSTITKRIVPHTALWGRKATHVLVSETISLPAGNRWDYLKVSSYSRGDPVYVDILDPTTSQPVPGMVNLLFEELDLSSIPSGSYPELRLRARFPEGEPANSSVLLDWGIKWIPDRTWRCEFLTDLRLTGLMGVVRDEGDAFKEGSSGIAGAVAFAESFDGVTRDVTSSVYIDGYPVAEIPVRNATDVAMADLDGDGITDIVLTSGEAGANASVHAGSPAGFDDAPTWTYPHSPGSTQGAWFRSVLIEDLESDGDSDVLLLEASGTGAADRVLVYVNGGGSWNSTPDMVVDCRGSTVSAMDAGHVDGDNWLDLVLGTTEGDVRAGAFVLWGSAGGYTSGWDRITQDAYFVPSTVHVGHLDDDAYEDVAFGGEDLTLVDGNRVYMGSANGLSISYEGFSRPPATAIAFSDWNGDGERDVVLVRDDRVTVLLHPFPTGGSTTLGISGGVDAVSVPSPFDPYDDMAIAANPFAGGGSDESHLLSLHGSSTFDQVVDTSGAVAVAGGEMFGQGVGALRSSVIDVGDPTRVGDWGTVSYRMSRGSPNGQQTLDLRLVDVDTGEVLWTGTGSEAEGAITVSPSVSAREHPRVYLDAFLDNQDPWLRMYVAHLEVNWTDRPTSAPRVLSITSDDDVIYRTNGTTLRISVSDEFDPPEDLAINVQMQTPGGGGWVSDRLGAPRWTGDEWTVAFTTIRDDPVGPYNFRVRAIDSDGITSDPLDMEQLVTVINNPPGAPTVTIAPGEPGTADDLTCQVVRQAFDRDTLNLDYLFTWYRYDVPVDDLTTSTVPHDLTLKGEEWRVVVVAFDGIDLGPRVEVRVTVRNSPPGLSKPLGTVQMLEDDPPLSIRLADHFADPDGDPIYFNLSSTEGVTAGIERGLLSISPHKDWFGTAEVTVNASDGEAMVSDVLTVDVQSIPDAPVVVSIGGAGPVGGWFQVEATQDVQSVFMTVVTDVDSTKFRFRSDGVFTSFDVVTGNGTIFIIPTNAEVGTLVFNLSVEDDTGNSVVVPVRVLVADVNDPPGPVTISNPRPGTVFEHDASVLLQGSCSDPDERHGQSLTFTWRSDKAGVLGTGRSLQVPDLPAGEHRITLEVTDGSVTRDASVRITVKAEPTDPGNGGGDGGDDEPFLTAAGGGNLLLLLLALALIVVVAVLVIYRRMRPSARAGEEEAGADAKEGELTMVEGIPVVTLRGSGDGADLRGPIGTDYRSVVMGTSARTPEAGDDIPASPWSPEELRSARAPVHAPRPVARSAEAAGWEEAPDEPPGPEVRGPPTAGQQPPVPAVAPDRKKLAQKEAEWEWEEV